MLPSLKSLFSSVVWAELWLALRRSLRDELARRNALRLIFAIAFTAIVGLAWLAGILYQFRFMYEDQEGRQVLGVGLIVAIVLVGTGLAARQVWEWRKEILWERSKQDCIGEEVGQELKLAVYDETCLLAALLERLASEVALEKELPPGFTVRTRRVLLDRLEDLKLRHTLEPWLLDVLLAPDGHWPMDLKERAMPAWETLAVLRWALGMAELRDLTVDPKYEVSDAIGFLEVKEPTKLSLVRSWKIRYALHDTEAFFQRCFTELVARGEMGDLPQEEVEEALREREVIQSYGYMADLLIGSRTISELPSPLLWLVAKRAYNRWGTLSFIAGIVTGDLAPIKLRELFAGFFDMTSSGKEQIVAKSDGIRAGHG